MNCRLRIALYQPDIAGNTGTILRFAACLGLGVDIIEPAGFPLSDKALKRAGMDYLEMAALTRHVDWHAFEDWRKTGAPAGAAVDQSHGRLHGFRLRRRRHIAVRPRIRRRSGSCPSGGGCAADHPHAGSGAQHQCRAVRRHGGGRSHPATRIGSATRRQHHVCRRRRQGLPHLLLPRRTSPSPAFAQTIFLRYKLNLT